MYGQVLGTRCGVPITRDNIPFPFLTLELYLTRILVSPSFKNCLMSTAQVLPLFIITSPAQEGP